MHAIDLTGQKFGRWTVVRRSTNTRQGQTRWLCLCECGSEDIVVSVVLRDGRSQSCGCLKSEKTIGRSRKHGHSHAGRISPTYHSWSGMKNRCTNTSDFKYPDYGGRGIKVCDRWKDFVNFLADMGERPKGTTIDRKNVNGDYEPDNCVWSTSKVQGRNKRNVTSVTVDGITRCVPEWAEVTGIPRSVIDYRLRHGWSPQRAVSAPSDGARNKPNLRMITLDNRTQSVTEWAREFGVPPHRVFARLYAGWSPKDALSMTMKKTC